MKCAAYTGERACDRDAAMIEPVPLCDFHRLQIALVMIPDLLRDQLASLARPVTVTPLLTGPHDPIVYFIGHGHRVKIGFTSNLKSRVNALALRADSVLLVLDGGVDLERALHARFSSARDGDTEWFDLTPQITEYIDGRKREPHRMPATIPKRKRATTPKSSSEGEQVALLTHLVEVIGDAPRMRTREALQLLTERWRDTYRKWTFQDLTRVLRAAGAPPYMSNGLATIARQDVIQALANRERQ